MQEGKKNYLFIILFLIIIFGFGLFLRYENIKGGNIVLDFDQYEDLFYTYKIAHDHKFPIIGRAVYGDARIHHGVFYYYYNFLPFLISNGNPFFSAYWNIFFNAATSFILFFLSRSMFKNNFPALLTAVLASVSFEFIKFSNWLTIDTVAIFTVPLFYFGLWQYYLKKNWGLLLSAVSLGLSIQSDLSFLYSIPVFLIYWIIFKPLFPKVKLLLSAVFILLLSTSTLILTEIKLNFSGVKTLLNFSSTFGETKLPVVQRLTLFLHDFGKDFSNNLFPQNPNLGIFLAGATILLSVFFLFKTKSRREKSGIYFLLLYLLSPAITLVLGYHQKPWFLIGLPPAIALISGYVISKLNTVLIFAVFTMIIASNVNIILSKPQKAYELFNSIYDTTSYLSYQLKVIDYTYENAASEAFAINAVTYPLYYNGMWAYLYNWYGKSKYGYTPFWLGGNQPHPYDLLSEGGDSGKFFYMIISETVRIPDVYKNLGRVWGLDSGKLIEKKTFDGFTVYKYAKSQTI